LIVVEYNYFCIDEKLVIVQDVLVTFYDLSDSKSK